jgi:sporulation protein YlmC with PRC-barrel domain
VRADEEKSGQTRTLRLEAPVACRDGAGGEIADIVIDPRTASVTHLVVAPHHEPWATRLVPLGRVTTADGKDVVLDCTRAELAGIEPTTESAFLPLGEVPVGTPGWDVGVADAIVMPGAGLEDVGLYSMAAAERAGVRYDRIPAGEAEVRSTSPVVSADGHEVGHLVGVVVDADGRLTDLVLVEGHLWRRRRVAVAAASVAAWKTDRIELRVSGDEVRRAGRHAHEPPQS